MILDDIQTKLEEIDPNVFFGMVNERMNKTLWNYIVFNRSVIRVSNTKNGYADVYAVNIVRENFVPDGLAEQVIDKVTEIPGMRITGEPEYNYYEKPGTKNVVEMLSIYFVKPRKA